MASHEQRAQDFLRQAEEKLRAPSGFFSFLTGGSSMRVEEAAELFSKAANNFKLAKQYDASGDAYLRAADLYLRSNVKHEAASCFVNASGSYRKVNIEGATRQMLMSMSMSISMARGLEELTVWWWCTECVNCLRKAIEYYTTEGRFSIAAKVRVQSQSHKIDIDRT